ncbi:unnamed protein product [Symbiodinium microadriaticum]|nr:unnamed protein product [Symbiodinium microadriaticum]
MMEFQVTDMSWHKPLHKLMLRATKFIARLEARAIVAMSPRLYRFRYDTRCVRKWDGSSKSMRHNRRFLSMGLQEECVRKEVKIRGLMQRRGRAQLERWAEPSPRLGFKVQCPEVVLPLRITESLQCKRLTRSKECVDMLASHCHVLVIRLMSGLGCDVLERCPDCPNVGFGKMPPFCLQTAAFSLRRCGVVLKHDIGGIGGNSAVSWRPPCFIFGGIGYGTWSTTKSRYALQYEGSSRLCVVVWNWLVPEACEFLSALGQAVLLRTTVAANCQHEESDGSVELLRDSTDAVDRKLMPRPVLGRVVSLDIRASLVGADMWLTDAGYACPFTSSGLHLDFALCIRVSWRYTGFFASKRLWLKSRRSGEKVMSMRDVQEALKAEPLVEGAWDPVLLLSFLPGHFLCSGFRLKIEMDGPQEASFQAAPRPDATKRAPRHHRSLREIKGSGEIFVQKAEVIVDRARSLRFALPALSEHFKLPADDRAAAFGCESTGAWVKRGSDREREALGKGYDEPWLPTQALNLGPKALVF